MLRAFWIVVAVLTAAPPAYALQPDQRGSLKRAIGSISRQIDYEKEPEKYLAALDALRPTITSPGELATLDGLRAKVLIKLGRVHEARALADAIVKGQPQSPHALVVAGEIAYFADDAVTAADRLSRASQLQSSVANMIPPYDLERMFSLLKADEKHEVAALFAQRLFDAGWTKGGPKFRSDRAMDVIEYLVERGQETEATRYIPNIVAPSSLARILTERRFTALVPTAETWGGAQLVKQWPIYLERTRGAWHETRTAEAASDYAEALSLAGHHATLVRTFQPRLNQPVDARRDDLFVFLYPVVAKSLAILGRWDEAFALLAQGRAKWPPESGANSINVSGNLAQLRLLKGDFHKARDEFAEVLRLAEAKADEVTEPMLATIRAYSLCARHRAGDPTSTREADLLSAVWAARQPDSMSWMHLCLRQHGRARQVWLSALQHPQSISRVVAFLQPSSTDVVDSDFAREMAKEVESLAQDPALIAAMSPHGVRRDWALRASAPEERAQ